MEDLLKKAQSWVDETNKTRRSLKDKAYDLTDEIVRKYGEDEGNKIVIDLVEKYDNTIVIMEHDIYEGGYIARDIEKIELSKEYGGISLIYGEEDYEYIKYSDVMLTDRLYLIDELISLIKG